MKNKYFVKSGAWAALLLTSATFAVFLSWAAVPASMLVGPMLAAVLFALRGARLAVSSWLFAAAQAVLGCIVAQTFTPAAFSVLVKNWPMMLCIVGLVISFGALMGLGLIRFGSLPGTTAAWGASPGGAAAMTAMSESFGADIRMVAFMQYLRLFIVVLTASLISRLLLGHAIDAPAQSWRPELATPSWSVLPALGLIGFGVFIGRMLRIPGGALLAPMLGGAALNHFGLMSFMTPPWLLWVAYALLGWYIGLRFTPDTVRYAIRSAPQILLSIATLITLCCGAAWLLHVWAGVDPLSAYLATSPGGLDSVVAIALSSDCDVPFVLTMQTLRLFMIILTGPLVARLICKICKCDSPKIAAPLCKGR